jgi:hypothetical protein
MLSLLLLMPAREKYPSGKKFSVFLLKCNFRMIIKDKFLIFKSFIFFDTVSAYRRQGLSGWDCFISDQK